MNIKSDSGQKRPVASLRGLMADMARFGVCFAPDEGPGVDGGEGNDGDDGVKKTPIKPPAPPKKTPPAPPAPVEPTGPSAREAELAQQLEALQARLAALGDADPDEIKTLRKLKQEQVARDAEAAKKAKEEEERRLREAGNFEALRERMAQEHQTAMEAANSRVIELDTTVGSLKSQIEALTMGAAFGSSRFLSEETVIGPSKARKIYGDYFDIEGSQLIAYDAPRGSERRVKIVDARGQPKPFEDAIKQIIEADPDRDRILRPKQKPGSGVVPTGTRAPEKAVDIRGLARLRTIVPSIMGNSK